MKKIHHRMIIKLKILTTCKKQLFAKIWKQEIKNMRKMGATTFLKRIWQPKSFQALKDRVSVKAKIEHNKTILRALSHQIRATES